MKAGGSGCQGLWSSREATAPWPVAESFRLPRRADAERAVGLLVALPERGLRQGGECMCETLSTHSPRNRPLGA